MSTIDSPSNTTNISPSIMISMELSNDTKWEKCEVRSFEEIKNKLTSDEYEILKNTHNLMIECHSDICDAGGHCDLGRKIINFNMIINYPYDSHGESLSQLQKKLKEQVTSIHDIYFYHSDKGTGIKGKADKRELSLWLKKMNLSITCVDKNGNSIIKIPDNCEIIKVLEIKQFF